MGKKRSKPQDARETSETAVASAVLDEADPVDRSTVDEDAIATELLERLTKLHRRATRSVVALSLVVAVVATWWAIHDSDVAHRGFLFASGVGLTGGVTFGAIFLTSFGLSLAASRAWMRRKAESARNEAVYVNKLGPDSLLWVVGMFSPKSKGMGFEDEIRQERGARRR